MRAISIKPDEKKVEVIDIYESIADVAAELEGPATLIHFLPNGARLYAVLGVEGRASFSLGGCAPVAGRGLIIGKRGKHGIYRSAHTDEHAIAGITRFLQGPQS
jgi:hypothetical protein